MATPIKPAGNPKKEASMNDGIYLKDNQVPYAEYVSERPLSNDIAENTAYILQHGGIVYDHYNNAIGSKPISFGTSRTLDVYMKKNNSEFGYNPSLNVQAAMSDETAPLIKKSMASENTSLSDFTEKIRREESSIVLPTPSNNNRGLVGMPKSDPKPMLKSGLVGSKLIKTATAEDEKKVLNEFRENRKSGDPCGKPGCPGTLFDNEEYATNWFRINQIQKVTSPSGDPLDFSRVLKNYYQKHGDQIRYFIRKESWEIFHKMKEKSDEQLKEYLEFKKEKEEEEKMKNTPEEKEDFTTIASNMVSLSALTEEEKEDLIDYWAYYDEEWSEMLVKDY